MWTKAHEIALAEAQKRFNEFESDEANKNSKNVGFHYLRILLLDHIINAI